MNTPDRYREQIAAVRERIAAAARRAERRPDDITLVVVSKYLDLAQTRILLETIGPGAVLGESRPQMLHQKAELLAGIFDGTPSMGEPANLLTMRFGGVTWHLIGPLQTNKIRMIAPWMDRLHSGESLAQLETVSREMVRIGRTLPVLLEVNISGESAKHGFIPDEIEPLLPSLASLDGLRVDGLMGMTSLDADESETRRQFAALRVLSERLSMNLPSEIRMEQLSIGMSDDFEIAIAEGATLVRIGSLITDPIGE